MVRTIQGVGKLDKIARARAAVEVNQRAGLISDKKAAALDAQITDAARDAGILGLANTVATGSGNAGGAFKASDKFGNKDGKIEPIEIIEWLGTLDIKGKPVVVPEGSSGTGPAPTNVGIIVALLEEQALLNQVLVPQLQNVVMIMLQAIRVCKQDIDKAA